MTSVEEIINWIFGGQVDASKIISIIVAVYAVVKSITEWVAKKKLIKSGLEQSALLEELKLARQENQTLKTAVAKLGDVVLTAYLSSNTVPVEVKRELGKIGDELNKAAAIPLSDTTTKLIQVVTEIAPSNDLIKHKEEIEEASKLAEDVIDGANEVAQSAIDKLTV